MSPQARETKAKINGILLRNKKEWNLVICDNMDGPWGHYTKWNKNDKYCVVSHVESKK